ncbi:MAG: AAA family ATPase [Fusobacteriaceae bacterium]
MENIEKKDLIKIVKKEIARKIVGQEDMVDKILIALLTGNHILLEGLPGLAKSLTVNSVAETLGLKFSRIQFTPDLLPSDIIGTEIYNEKTGEFHIKKGPIFANVILADEINRAPAKVQSALLEAMQEKQVTIANETYRLEQPFIVLATQNPIDQDGTYSLPEAQQDRFIMKVKVEYPTREEEKKIMDILTGSEIFEDIKIKKILTGEMIDSMKKEVRAIHIDERLKDYILELVFKTRESSDKISFGASPRASIGLVQAVKANAYISGREFVLPEDIKRVVYDVFRHRVGTTYEAEAENIGVEEIIADIIQKIELP